MKITVYKGKYGCSALAKGKETKMYIQIQIREEDQEKLTEGKGYDIDISEGFFSSYAKKDGTVVPKFVALKYEVLGETEYKPSFDVEDIPVTFSESGDGLPF